MNVTIMPHRVERRKVNAGWRCKRSPSGKWNDSWFKSNGPHCHLSCPNAGEDMRIIVVIIIRMCLLY